MTPTPTSPASASPDERARFPLALKLGLLVTLLTVIPLFGVGLALIDINVRELEDRVREFQIQIGDDLGRTLDDELARSRLTLDAVRRALLAPGPDDATRIALASSLLDDAGRDDAGGMDEVSVYQSDARFVDALRTREGGPVAPERVPDAVRAALATAEVAFGEAIPGTPTRLPMYVPLKVDGRITGYLGSRVPLRAVQQRVERLGQAHFSELAEPLAVVDLERHVIAAYGTGSGSNASSSPLLDQHTSASHEAGVSLSLRYRSADDTPMVGVLVPLRGHPWAVVVQQPESVVFGSVRQMRRVVAGTIALAMILAVVLAIVLSHRITSPVRILARFAADLSARRFDRRVTVETGDELSILGKAMSDAAANLEASEDRIKEEVAIRTDLGRYLPGELVEKVVAREQDMALGGRRSQITVVFADVVGFTPLTERLDAETVVGLLNELFTLLTDIVFRHGGTVDKFVGDCVMAIWGAPRATEDHAERALEAAEDMLRFVEVSSRGWEERFGVSLQLAIGVNTGEAIVGNIGSETRMEYTAIGDVVNVAAHLESIARPMQILCTQTTSDAAGDVFQFASIGEQEVPGRIGRIQVYEVRT